MYTARLNSTSTLSLHFTDAETRTCRVLLVTVPFVFFG